MSIDQMNVFSAFLDRIGCKNQYLKNAWYKSLEEMNKEPDSEDAERYISGRFLWDKTKEGKDFWEKVNEKWESTVKDLNL